MQAQVWWYMPHLHATGSDGAAFRISGLGYPNQKYKLRGRRASEKVSRDESGNLSLEEERLFINPYCASQHAKR